MAEKNSLKPQHESSNFSVNETTTDLKPCNSSDPNEWCPKHGPHPSD